MFLYVCKQTFHISKQCYNAKPSAFYFYVKTKILVDFHTSISVPLSEAFSYPITSMPVSIASLHSSLFQSNKAGFRIYIMKLSNSVSCSFPHIAKWFIDGMAAMRSIKPRSIYIEWFIDLLKYITPHANVNAHLFDNIIDM